MAQSSMYHARPHYIERLWRSLGAAPGASDLWRNRGAMADSSELQAVSLDSMDSQDPRFYELWCREQEKCNQREPSEIAMIQETLLPQLHSLISDCSICFSTGVQTKVLPCHPDHVFCSDCLTRTWSIVGRLPCPACRQDVQESMARAAGMCDTAASTTAAPTSAAAAAGPALAAATLPPTSGAATLPPAAPTSSAPAAGPAPATAAAAPNIGAADLPTAAAAADPAPATAAEVPNIGTRDLAAEGPAGADEKVEPAPAGVLRASSAKTSSAIVQRTARQYRQELLRGYVEVHVAAGQPKRKRFLTEQTAKRHREHDFDPASVCSGGSPPPGRPGKGPGRRPREGRKCMYRDSPLPRDTWGVCGTFADLCRRQCQPRRST